MIVEGSGGLRCICEESLPEGLGTDEGPPGVEF